MEQNASDFRVGSDYPYLTALRVPRPTLLIYNAEDDCCFRAPLVKPYIFDAVRPIFALFGSERSFEWHENTNPSTHNYGLDKRLAAYQFLAKHLGLPEVTTESPVSSELKTKEELTIGLPADNLTILGLARKLAAEIKHPEPERNRLKQLLRYRDVEVERAWALENSKNRGLETRPYRIDFSHGLSASAVWLKAIDEAPTSRASLVRRDSGKVDASAACSDRVNRGEQVLAIDLLFFGDASPKKPSANDFTQLLATTGDRPPWVWSLLNYQPLLRGSDKQ